MKDRAELRRLMERLADGDRAAFAPVFALLWPQLRAFAARYAGPDGEDAAQSALLKVFSRAGEFDPERDPLAWALGITAWECRTLQRKRQRAKEESAAVEREAGDPSPEEAVIQRDLVAAAESIVGTLRPLDAETLVSIATNRKTGATFRKRAERALTRFRLAWRARHGAD